MAISAPPGKGRGRESVRACVREGEGETACGAGGGEGEGEGARVCAAANGRLRAPQAVPGSPGSAELRGTVRKSPRPRGLQRWRARGVPCPAGRGRSPPRGSVSKKSPFGAGAFPGCKARGGGVLLAAVGRQPEIPPWLQPPEGAERRPVRCSRPTAPPPTSGSRPERHPQGAAPRPSAPRTAPVSTPDSAAPLQHRGQRRAHSAPRAPRGRAPASARPPSTGGPGRALWGSPLRPGTWGETGRASLLRRAREGHGLGAVRRASGEQGVSCK